MSIELRASRDGKLRPTWYGRHMVNGRRITVNLEVRVAGTPPASLSLQERGDEAFENSRAEAERAMARMVGELRTPQRAAHLVERIYEIKVGEKLKPVRLDELPDAWEKIPRRREPDKRYMAQCRSTLARFTKSVHDQDGRISELGNVSRDVARAFLAEEAGRGVSPKTWNDTLKLLRAVYKHLMPPGSMNPFLDVPTRDTDTVFRHPFTPAELRAITEAARDDDFIRPILITGMCTAMRRGDCCLLRWRDVDMERRFISVKTSKTGVTVSIPIFPLLYDELLRLKRGDAYVFPEQARMYLENPDGITWRVQKVLVAALSSNKGGVATPVPELSPAETGDRVRQYLAGLTPSAKSARMQLVFDRYMAGKSLDDIVAESGISKGSVYGYLYELQGEIRSRVLRGHGELHGKTAAVKADRDILRQKREHGNSLRRASVRDFHSFRVTWVTLALAAGVPMELVTRVTGHKTTDIVLKHYFQPGREQFRQALQSAMPALLTYSTEKSPKEDALAFLDEMGDKLTPQEKKQFQDIIAKLG